MPPLKLESLPKMHGFRPDVASYPLRVRPWWQRVELGWMTIRPDGRLVCHVCVCGFHALGQHVSQVHGLTADAYRKKFKLPADVTLQSASARMRHRTGCRESPLTAHLSWPRRRVEDIRIDGELVE